MIVPSQLILLRGGQMYHYLSVNTLCTTTLCTTDDDLKLLSLVAVGWRATIGHSWFNQYEWPYGPGLRGGVDLWTVF